MYLFIFINDTATTEIYTLSLHDALPIYDLGIAVAFKAIVGDNRDELTAHVAHALARHQVLILTGGLGPTDDDLTRERSEEHTSELQSRLHLVCRLLLEKKKKKKTKKH